MLISNPTENGTGLQLWGDYRDISSLRGTVLKIRDVNNNVPREFIRESSKILFQFLDELKRALRSERLTKQFNDFEGNNVAYYGINIDWITFIYTISCLRRNASFTKLNELDFANLLMLEFCGKHTAKTYDSKGAKAIMECITEGIHIDKYSYHLKQLALDNYFAMKANITRFRKICLIINEINFSGKDRRFFEKFIEKEAARLNCDISELKSECLTTNIVW